LMKTTVWRKRNSVSTASLINYVKAIRLFTNFWRLSKPEFSINDLNRKVVDSFLFSIKDRSVNTRATYHSALTEIFNSWVEWDYLPKGARIIDRDMKPRIDRRNGQHIKYLDQKNQQILLNRITPPKSYFDIFIHILLQTGARASEILKLDYHCLSKDTTGWYLTRMNAKFHKPHTVPIDDELAKHINSQISNTKLVCTQSKLDNPNKWIFIHGSNTTVIKYSLRHMNNKLSTLLDELDLKDSHGRPIQLSTHVFRHTVGTNLINNGVPQHHVQKFLGHESPEMTAVYAQMHDQTLRKSLAFTTKKLVDIKGNLYKEIDVWNEISGPQSETVNPESKWLRRNIATQSLPNGICALPIKQSCPHANACLTCPSFRTDEQFIDIHQAQLLRTERLIEDAAKQGMLRQAQLNQEVAKNLNNIIGAING
jgi:integrase/recombinase XerD